VFLEKFGASFAGVCMCAWMGNNWCRSWKWIARRRWRRLSTRKCRAQAVVARSFLIAAPHRHQGFDFCDTTHCQYLREPPPDGGPSRRAEQTTKGLALTYHGRTVLALYSADCGGRTRTPADAGWQMDGYPYFAVECPVRGEVSGHQVGLCQTGAAELARRGMSFRDILAHYFPATLIEAARE
jgi:stage II sporulation protein D